ncbi:MAG: S8 family peptidase, partial [Clostridium sp.]
MMDRENQNTSVNNKPIDKKSVFNSPDYVNYIVQYYGTYDPALEALPYVYITPIDKNFAIVSIKFDLLERIEDTAEVEDIFKKYVDAEKIGVVYVQPPDLYSLAQISAIEAADIIPIQEQYSLDLTGKGVIIGIVDTGIDYLNEEFQDKDGNTRINIIWDQTIESDNQEYVVSFGTVYSKEKISKAIETFKTGGNPYIIVPSVDKNGHGTHMAGILGAIGKNPAIRGVAPQCEFAVVKMVEGVTFKKFNNLGDEVVAYNSMAVFSALSFLKEYAVRRKEPIVILLPVGTTNGNHKGQHILDAYIETITNNVGIIVVSPTGNEGISDGHVSGIVLNSAVNQDIELLIAKSQRTFYVGVWVDLPNIVGIDVISPSGQSTGIIQAVLNQKQHYGFVLEGTRTDIYFDLPERFTGDELIRLYFYDVTPGLWRIRLNLQRGITAVYNAWMWQKEFVSEGTRFSPSDPYGTITIPADSDYTVAVAGYNQNNTNLLPYSGASLINDYLGRIDFAAGGVNTPTTGLNNTIAVINGTSLSAAVGAGVCALLLEWGIVKGNYPYMYTQSIKTFLRRGTVQRRGDVYPNQNIGYG